MNTSPTPDYRASSESSEQKRQAALHQAMTGGKSSFLQQLRYVLMLAQLVHTPLPAQDPFPKTLTHARLEVLVQMGGRLPASHLPRLVQDVLAVTPLAMRWLLLAQLLPYLPVDERERHIQMIWQNIGRLYVTDRARVLFYLAQALPRTGKPVPTPLGGFLVAHAQRLRDPVARLRALSGIAQHLPAKYAQDLWGKIVAEMARLRDETLIAKTIVALLPELPATQHDNVGNIIQNLPTPAHRAQALMAFFAHVELGEAREAWVDFAVATLENIPVEEDLAEAFVGMMPLLGEVPHETLERLLSLSIRVQRQGVQARLFVAMASHVAHDLQGEAIAAAHSITNERNRAQLLVSLAPHLTPNMLVASLAVAYTMQEHDSRLRVLTVLARFAPQSAKAQTSRDALAAAVSLPNAYERVLALVNLGDVLTGLLQEQALSNALDSITRIENESARGRALSALAPQLTANGLEQALTMARSIRNAEHRLNGLLGVLPHLPPYYQPEVVQDLFACVVTMPLEYKRAHALMSIAPFIGIDDLAQLEDLTTTLSDPADAFNVTVTMLQHAPPEERERIAKMAWEHLHRIEVGYERTNAIAQLLPYLTDSAKETLKPLAREAVEDVEDEYDRASVLASLAPLLLDAPLKATLPTRNALLAQAAEATLQIANTDERTSQLQRCASLWEVGDAETAFALWQSTLKYIARLPLAEALPALGALMPILIDFVPEDTLLDVAQLLGLR